MGQEAPKKKKRKLPKDILERDDRHLMECIFGKRTMKKVDRVLKELDDRKGKGDVSIP